MWSEGEGEEEEEDDSGLHGAVGAWLFSCRCFVIQLADTSSNDENSARSLKITTKLREHREVSQCVEQAELLQSTVIQLTMGKQDKQPQRPGESS